MGHLLCGVERVVFCEHQFALHLSQPKKGKEKGRRYLQWKKYLDAHCVH